MKPAQGTDAALVRTFALNQRALLSTWSFLLLLFSTVILVAFTLLFAVDWSRPVMLAGYEFFPLASSDPDAMPAWMQGFAARFDDLRGNAVGSPLTWLSFLTIAVLLFFVDYSRFTPPKAASSLLADPVSAPVARNILDRFGFFRDLRAAQMNDTVAFGRTVFTGSARVSRIVSGKSSHVQQSSLRFFMAHEYVHALFRDNLAHTLFRLVLFWVSGIVSAYTALTVWPTMMVVVPLASNPAVSSSISIALTALVLCSVALSIYGVVLSYIKLREYHSDVAAYALVGNDEDAYGEDGEHPRPNPGSAWSRSLSRHERAAHRHDQSLHAQNLIPGALVLHAGLRSVYMLVAPPGWAMLVLCYDTAFIVSMLLALRSLPRLPGDPTARPLLPWLLAAFALLALSLSTIGLLGFLVLYMGLPMPDDAYRYTLSTPLLIEAAIAVATAVGLGFRWLLKRPSGAVQRWSVLRSGGLGLLAFPGLALSAIMLVSFLMLGSATLSTMFAGLAALPSATADTLVAAIVTALLLAATALVYRNLRVLNGYLFAIDVVITALATFAMVTCLAAIVSVFARTPPDFAADEAEVAISAIMQRLTADDLLVSAIAATIVTLVYIGLRCLEFWARKLLRRQGE